MNKIYLLIFIVVFSSVNIFSQDKGGKLWGYVFGDYYYKVNGDSTGGSTQYAGFPKSFQAFEIRRVYLGYDYTFNDKFSAQFLLEGNDKILTNSRLGIFIKTAYVEWKALDHASFSIGLVPTPTWSWALNEKAWNYRSIEKTILDMRGLGNASDLGIATRGKFDKAGNYGFGLMIGNGNGQRPEINKFKKYYGTLFAKPVSGLSFEVYGDYEPNSGDKNKTTLKGFTSYQTKKFTIGAEVIQQTQQNAGGTDIDVVPFGISGFVWGTLFAKKEVPVLNAFARFDYYDPDSKNDSVGYKENFITAGLDYMPIENVHIMPNVWVNSYTAKTSGGTEKRADVVARMTFYYVYR
jgi:hypothetical protein